MDSTETHQNRTETRSRDQEKPPIIRIEDCLQTAQTGMERGQAEAHAVVAGSQDILSTPFATEEERQAALGISAEAARAKQSFFGRMAAAVSNAYSFLDKPPRVDAAPATPTAPLPEGSPAPEDPKVAAERKLEEERLAKLRGAIAERGQAEKATQEELSEEDKRRAVELLKKAEQGVQERAALVIERRLGIVREATQKKAEAHERMRRYPFTTKAGKQAHADWIAAGKELNALTLSESKQFVGRGVLDILQAEKRLRKLPEAGVLSTGEYKQFVKDRQKTYKQEAQKAREQAVNDLVHSQGRIHRREIQQKVDTTIAQPPVGAEVISLSPARVGDASSSQEDGEAVDISLVVPDNVHQAAKWFEDLGKAEPAVAFSSLHDLLTAHRGRFTREEVRQVWDTLSVVRQHPASRAVVVPDFYGAYSMKTYKEFADKFAQPRPAVQRSQESQDSRFAAAA